MPPTTGAPPAQLFDGIRLIDVGHIVAGPIASSVFADFGADVIKIERPSRGDSLRWLYKKGDAGLFYKMSARNKRCITLDLKQPEGQELLHRLVPSADAIVENFRPGVMEAMNLGWDVLHALNERLILCRVSGFGQTGPYAHRRAYGRIGEAFGGFAHLTGEPDGPPMHSAMSLGDTVAGIWAAKAIMMALYWRDAQGGGVGQEIDVALYEPLYRQIEQQIIVYDQLDVVPTRMGNQNPGVPFVGSYPTADGKYFSISSNTFESIEATLRAMGFHEHEKFNQFDRCLEHRDEFHAAVTAWMGARTAAEIDEAFQACNAPGSPVMTAAELVKDPHIKAREMVLTVDDDELGPIRMQGIVPKFSRTPGEVRFAGPAMGSHNEEVFCGELGLTQAELSGLIDRGVV